MSAVATNSTAPASSAAGVSWDLDAAHGRARAFEAAYRGRIQAGPDARLLLAALTELEGLSEQMDRPAIYAGLLHAAKTDDPRHGALLMQTRERRTAINKHLIFFDLEWIQVPDAKAAALCADPALARFRHYLEQKRAWKPHYLSEPEEKVIEEKTTTGRAAFVRLFDESVAALTFPF